MKFFLASWMLLFCMFTLAIPLMREVVRANSMEGGYYFSAPNGFYNVFLTHVDYEKHIVEFPLCPSSGSELQGGFKFQEGLLFPKLYYGWLVVALYENEVVWWHYH